MIDQVGSDGSFLGEEHTYNHFRETWHPSLLNRGNYEQWATATGMLLGDRANQRVKEILEEHEPAPLSQELIAELDALEEKWWHEAPN